MDINVKVNVDAEKAIEKLERIRDLYKEINELKKEEVRVRIINKADIEKLKTNVY